MKNNSKIYTIIFTLYIVFYKTIFSFKGELVTYIIHPLIIIFFSIVGYILFYKDKYYKYKSVAFYEVVRSSLIYIFFFYSAGLFIGYSNNPYSRDINGIIINFFSILMVVGLKEFIRGTIINEVNNKKILYFSLIWFIFALSDLNFILIIESLTSFNSLILSFIIYIVPVLAINLFCNYLCINGGFTVSLLYRILILFISLIIPIIPDYHPVIPTLFDSLIPFFTYLLIRHQINKRGVNKYNEDINPKSWIVTFLVFTLLLLFAVGTFPVKPVVILSGSMRPNIKEGDLLIIKKCEFKDIETNNIIEFNTEGYNVVHRVIRIENYKESKALVTKGDNNLKEDKNKVLKEDLRGCLSIKIPYAGYPTYFIRNILKQKT